MLFKVHFKKGKFIMKKTAIRIVSISLVIIMACFALASCSNAPSGTYGNDACTLKFSGETVEISYGSESKKTTVEGTFEMGEDEEGNMTITITLPEAESFLDIAYIAVRTSLDGTHKYNVGEDTNGSYIEIGVAKFYKE